MKIIDGLYIPEKQTIIPGRPLWPNIGRLPKLPRPDLPPFWECAIAPRAGNGGQFNAASTTLGGFNCQVNDVIVVTLGIRTTTSTVTSITDSIGNTYSASQSLAFNNGTLTRTEEWWVISTGANTINQITVNLTATSKFVLLGESYSGALATGNTATNSGTSTAPAVTLVTQDTNNWIAMASSSQTGATYTATSPNAIRQNSATTGGGGSTNVGGAEGDAGAFAAAGSHTVTFALSGSSAWATAGLELRSVAAATERHQTRRVRTVMGFH